MTINRQQYPINKTEINHVLNVLIEEHTNPNEIPNYVPEILKHIQTFINENYKD